MTVRKMLQVFWSWGKW